MNGLMVPKAIEGLRVEACQAFTSSMLEVSILSQAIATGTAMAVAGRNKLMLARTSEFKATLDSLLMVNAHAVTQHWNQRHLQANSCRVQQTFKALGVDLKKMLPHKSLATLVSGGPAWASKSSPTQKEASTERLPHAARTHLPRTQAQRLLLPAMSPADHLGWDKVRRGPLHREPGKDDAGNQGKLSLVEPQR